MSWASKLSSRGAATAVDASRHDVLLQNLPAHVAILSPDGTVEYINHARDDLLAEEAIGRSANEFLAPSSQDVAAKCIEAAVRDGLSSECELVDIDGRAYLTRCAPIQNEEGEPAVLMVATDITKHKRAEAALRQSEQKYRELVENINDVIFSLDTEGRLTFVSHGVEVVGGYAPSELVGRPFVEFIHPDDVAVVCAAFESALGGRSEPNEYRVRTKAGHYRWVRSHSRAVRVDGEVVGVRGVLADVTERRRTEEALREAEGRYRSMFENAVFGLYLSTPDGRFLDVNRALVSMLGYDSAEELRARDIADALYVDPAERERLVERFSQSETFGGVEVDWKTKQGTPIRVRLSGRVLRSDEGAINGFEVIAEDVTEKHAMEEQYRQAQKMEAIGRLAGGVAHDFNNLLTVINGHAELALSTLDTSDVCYEDLAEIRRAGERAAALTAQLLAFSRRQIVRPTVLDLNEVIADSAEMLRRIIGEDIELDTRLEENLGSVVADRSQVEQVIMNLAVNARDAMPEGGCLVLATGGERVESTRTLDQTTMPPGRYIAMSCRDTGCGISEAIRPHIFEPFFTTKEESRGTGLGLSTVYGSVEQCGGYIDVRSEIGKGSCFTVYFPEVASVPEVVAQVESASEGQTLDLGCILVVEDDDAVRITAVEMLEKCGYTVLEARDASEALSLSEERLGSLSLLITDVVMPGMSGPAMAERMTKNNPELRVLYMTGYADEEVLSERLRDGDAVLLKKPFSFTTIVEKVRQAMRAVP